MSAIKNINSALISVFSKDGLEDLVRKLNEQGVTIYSTGGTENYVDFLINGLLKKGHEVLFVTLGSSNLNNIEQMKSLRYLKKDNTILKLKRIYLIPLKC